MSETKDKKFTHDQVIEVGGEYLKCKKSGKWVSESDLEDYEKEMLKRCFSKNIIVNKCRNLYDDLLCK